MGTNNSILVVVPCYNHGKYLKESVESILAQTYQDFNISIVDDGSTDNTEEVARGLAELDKRITYNKLDKNVGKWFCLNLAIQNSTCNLVTCQDADDVSLKDRLERQMICLQETSTVHNLCGFHHCYSDEDILKYKDDIKDTNLDIMGPSEVAQHVSAGYSHPGINHYYTGKFETAGASAMFYKNVWDLGFRFNPANAGLRVLCSEDSDFNFRVTAGLGHTSVLKEKLYCYRRNTSTNNEDK